MSNIKNNSATGGDRYLLDDEERWESLGFDWESWNATVRKILRKQTVSSSGQSATRPRSASSRGRMSTTNWMA